VRTTTVLSRTVVRRRERLTGERHLVAVLPERSDQARSALAVQENRYCAYWRERVRAAERRTSGDGLGVARHGVLGPVALDAVDDGSDQALMS
jgi:hypothetical protein